MIDSSYHRSRFFSFARPEVGRVFQQTVRLKNLLRLQYGSALPAEARQEGTFSVYGSNGPVGSHNRANMLPPAIIVGRKGSHGKITWAEEGGFCIDTALFTDRRYTTANLRYVYYLLQTLGLDEPSKDSPVPGLDRGEVHDRPIPIVDLHTQKEIAEFLDRETRHIDGLIQKREEFPKLIEEKKAALAARAVNGSVLGFVTEATQRWFGELVPGWPVRRAKFLFRERQNRSQAGHEELLTVSHITGVTRRAEKDVNMFLAESMEGYKLVSRGDVVVNTMWAWMGAMGVSPSYSRYGRDSLAGVA